MTSTVAYYASVINLDKRYYIVIIRAWIGSVARRAGSGTPPSALTGSTAVHTAG